MESVCEKSYGNGIDSNAQLTPDMTGLQNSGVFTRLLVMQEELKTLPFGDVWNEYCARCGVPADGQWYETVAHYENEVLKKRG